MSSAAACTSLTVDWAVGGLAGLTRTPTRAAVSNSSRSRPSRFAASSVTKKLMPVTLPPGRARLATRPYSTGFPPMAKTIGIVEVAALAAFAATGLPGVTITLTCRRTSSAASSGNRWYRFRPPVFDRHVLAFEVAGFIQAPPEGSHTVGGGLGRPRVEPPDHRHRWLLRASRQRPRRRRAAEQRDELAPLHSMTSSASCWRCKGTSR